MSVPALTRLCSLPVFPCPLPLHIPGRIASRSPSGCGESLGTGLALFSFCYSLLLWPLWFNRRLNFLLKGCAQRSHTHSFDKLNLRRQRRTHSVYTDVDRSQLFINTVSVVHIGLSVESLVQWAGCCLYELCVCVQCKSQYT